MTARYLVGDVFDCMAELEDGSVDLILTSPPFLALRSYLPADHPDKAREIGSEPTPAAFIDTLLALTTEWRRLLAPHGSIAIELGDTYAGSGGDSGPRLVGSREYRPEREGTTADGGDRVVPANAGPGWPLDKSLCLIPELYRIGLVYGVNALTGQESPAGVWRARNVVRWCRPNPPVGALGDKVRPATSDMVIACTSRARYFDLDAVRTPHVNARPQETNGQKNATREGGQGHGFDKRTVHEAGAPPLDHWWHDHYEQDAWLIPTAPYKGSHYATWPPQLCVTPVKSMCPERVCRVCGEPSRRITEATHDVEEQRRRREYGITGGKGLNADRGDGGASTSFLTTTNATLGWSDCGHDNYRPGVVLDPFAGSGTTLAVATGLGRHAIGIDLDSRNAELARERVGMFLTIEDAPEAVA